MSDQTLIEAENVFLHIPVFKPSERTLSINPLKLMSKFYSNRSSRNITILLNNINFTMNKGERLGIMGPNGAGKTTLLRLLSGIYRPSGGNLQIHGSAYGLYDVKFGVNPEATGVENIYLRGIQMGLPLTKIRELAPQVAEFSGLGTSINDVFKDYSTGMKLRLAVAISTMIEPDILVMDEWIGSGDNEFRKKVDKRMDTLINKSRGLILASHSEQLLKSLCTHGLVLSGGNILFYGKMDDAVKYYHDNKIMALPAKRAKTTF